MTDSPTVQMCKAMGDSARLHILMLLQQHGRLCVCELMSALDVLQPKVSRNLTILRHAGLIHGEREGKWMFYQLESRIPQWVSELLAEECRADQHHMAQFAANLAAMETRPERCC